MSSIKCILLGYADYSKAYVVQDLSNMRVVLSNQVKFTETFLQSASASADPAIIQSSQRPSAPSSSMPQFIELSLPHDDATPLTDLPISRSLTSALAICSSLCCRITQPSTIVSGPAAESNQSSACSGLVEEGEEEEYLLSSTPTPSQPDSPPTSSRPQRNRRPRERFNITHWTMSIAPKLQPDNEPVSYAEAMQSADSRNGCKQ
jgi:hypothetical protein